MSKQQRIRVRLPDGRILSFTPISYEFVDIRLRTQKPKPAPAGCPRCAQALSLMPDLTERKN